MGAGFETDPPGYEPDEIAVTKISSFYARQKSRVQILYRPPYFYFVSRRIHVPSCRKEMLASYGCVLNSLPSFLQMRRIIVFPELALWAREPIAVAHIPTK